MVFKIQRRRLSAPAVHRSSRSTLSLHEHSGTPEYHLAPAPNKDLTTESKIRLAAHVAGPCTAVPIFTKKIIATEVSYLRVADMSTPTA